MRLRGVSLVVCASLFAACAPDVADDASNNTDTIIRGKEEKKLPQVVFVRVNGFSGGWTLCTGTYFASRVVVTAAHCRRNDAIPGQTFVYYGNDYFTDVATLPNIPAPGQPSVWARVETMAVHPDYNPTVNYPDFAIMHLDRVLPFDPIPLLRAPVTSADKKGEIAGWGGSKALTADITQVEGVGIKRSAKVKILGTPTEADFHADDPNLGILDPAIRANLLKTDGMKPSANTCAGDSGGPLLVKVHGRDYLAGVGFWTGLFCEDYAIFTRIDPFLAYFDDAVLRAGKAPIIPRLECVEDQGDGSFRGPVRLPQRQRADREHPLRLEEFLRQGHRECAADGVPSRRLPVRFLRPVHQRPDAAVDAASRPAGPRPSCRRARRRRSATPTTRRSSAPSHATPRWRRNARTRTPPVRGASTSAWRTPTSSPGTSPAAPNGTPTSPASRTCRRRRRTGAARPASRRSRSRPDCDAEIATLYTCAGY